MMLIVKYCSRGRCRSKGVKQKTTDDHEIVFLPYCRTLTLLPDMGFRIICGCMYCVHQAFDAYCIDKMWCFSKVPRHCGEED